MQWKRKMEVVGMRAMWIYNDELDRYVAREICHEYLILNNTNTKRHI